MRKTGKRFVIACLSGVLSLGNSVPSVLASDLENQTAVAGMSITINNYYAASETPAEEILTYLSEQTAPAEPEAAVIAPEVVATVAAQIQAEEPESEDAAVAEAEEKSTGLVSVLGSLNVREEPSAEAEILATLYSNTQIDILDTVSNEEGDWYQVEWEEIEGYVKADYVLTGEVAETRQTITANMTAEVIVESLEVFDSAREGAKQLDTIHEGEIYNVMEIQGNFVKLRKKDYALGYVSMDGVKLATSLSKAPDGTETETEQILDYYMQDINYTKAVYLQRVSDGTWADAHAAAVYLVELWGYYINDAEAAGLTELAAEAGAEREIAIALMDEAAERAAGNVPAEDTGVELALSPVETDATAIVREAPEAAADAVQPVQENAEPQIIVPVEQESPAAQVTAIEAFYRGGDKHAGDMIYSSELYLMAAYSDGTFGQITEGWSSPDVGMILTEGRRTVTMYYDQYASSFELNILPAAAQPSVDPVQQAEPAVPQTEPAAPQAEVPPDPP